MTRHILALEDESAIREMIEFALTRENYRVSTAANVPAATAILSTESIDLALVDWMLPGANGLEFVRQLRREETTRTIPIIMLTARTEEHDITTGLDAGADDYITKPFSPRELNSRIKALLRRSSDFDENSRLQRGALTLDDATREVTAGDVALTIALTEYKLLRFLMHNSERVYSRSQLLDHVWGSGTYIEERTVDVHILRLRKLLKPTGLDWMIQTVRGAGYRFSQKENR